MLLDQGRADEACDALALADQNSVTAFHANLFRFLAARARVSQARGAAEGAAADTAQALDLVGAPDQYSRHPGIGAVDPSDPTIPLLRSMLPGG